MNKAIDIMNEALVSRRMLPLDGYCTCAACGRSDLQRDEVDGNYCRECLDDASNYGSDSFREIDYETVEFVYDYVRGKRVEL